MAFSPEFEHIPHEFLHFIKGSWGRSPTCHLSTLPRTGPQPVLNPLHQPGLDRIPLDISHDSIKFPLVPYPMVIRLILPEWYSRPAEDQVGGARAGALQRSGHSAQRFQWLQKHVDMVRHDNPGVQVVQRPLSCPDEQSLCHTLGNATVLEPRRTGLRPVHLTIESQKTLSFGFGFLTGRSNIGAPARHQGHGTIQLPGNEERSSFRMPLGQTTAVILHDEKVRVTAKILARYMAGRGPAPLYMAGRGPAPRRPGDRPLLRFTKCRNSRHRDSSRRRTAVRRIR